MYIHVHAYVQDTFIDQPDISSKSTTGGEAVTINDKGDQLHVGKSFSTFADFQRALNEFKKGGSHPLIVEQVKTTILRGLVESTQRIQWTFLSSSSPRSITVCVVYTLEMHGPEVQQQRDGSSCGLFALALAETLAEGTDLTARNKELNGSDNCSSAK